MLTTIFSFLGALAGIRGARAGSRVGGLSRIEIGTWAFFIPHDWKLKSGHVPDVPYFESDDGTKGCYVKSLKFNSTPPRTEVEIAKHIQRVHQTSFAQDAKAKWQVVSEQIYQNAGITYATLDLFDADANYCVLSKVLVKGQVAIQLTLHDYLCKNYSASVRYFSSIVESVHARKPDA